MRHGIVIAVAALLGLLTPLPSAAQAPAAAPAALTAEQWRADLRTMAAEMERRHKNLYHKVSRADFAAAVADLDARIPTLRRNQIIVGMMRIAALVGDGHTRIEPLKDPRIGFPSLPLKLYLFDDGLYVRATTAAFAPLAGARVEAIGGVPVEEAIRRARSISAAENDSGPNFWVPIFLAMPDVLNALGLSDTPSAATLRLSKGKRTWTVTVPSGQLDPPWPPDTDISLVTPEGWTDARTAPAPPLWLQAPLDYHRLVDLPEQRALYAQLNMVTDTNGQTLTAFGERIRARAEATNPRSIVLDLRLNRGGNGELINGFVTQLIKAEDADTRLFVLTGRGTFSASQFILDDLDRLTGAVFVGEPAASRPTGYGDSYRVVLPNSGITVRTSIAYWQDGQNMAPWTWVDVAAPLRFADYAAGRDPALEAALAYAPPPPLSDVLLAAAKAGGPAALDAALEKYRADPVNRYADIARHIVRAVQALDRAKSPEAALALAGLGVRHYPGSVDLHILRAFLADRQGDKALARRSAAEVLRLDPNNRGIRSLAERLG